MTARTWRRRFIERGLDGLRDDPRPGVPRKSTDVDAELVIVKTLEETPKNATHWSTRSTESTDPLCMDKVRDVVGLYLDPSEMTLVHCVTEKSQIQAQDWAQSVLPMMPGVSERRSRDYIRAGTTTLFAALEVATGKVTGSLHRRHRAAEFKKFLARWTKRFRTVSRSI